MTTPSVVATEHVAIFCEEKLVFSKGNQTSQDTSEKSSSHLEVLGKDCLTVAGEFGISGLIRPH